MDRQALALLKRTNTYFRERAQPAYVVGGSLRDLLLAEEYSDWDLVTGGNAHTLARRLADALGGFYVRMHDQASRVVAKYETDEGATAITLDISPMQGASIEDDLRRRDFTINALAAPLDEVVAYLEDVAKMGDGEGNRGMDDNGKEGVRESSPYMSLRNRVIDPLRGLQDLEARRVRVVGDDVFRQDPLRMLRAVRLVTRLRHYGFVLDGQTRGLILRDAALLPGVAAERIHDELYAILDPVGTTGHLRLLDALGLLTMLIPEFTPARGMRQPYPHYWDVLEHSLETAGAMELVAALVGPGDERGAAIDSVDGGASGHVGMPLVGIRDVGIRPMGIRQAADSENIMEIRNILQEAEQQGIFSFADLTSPRMKLAALLHDIGKPATASTGEDGAIHFYNHPQVGAALAQQITRRLGASTQDRRLTQQVAAHHMRPGQLGQDAPVTPRAIRRFFVDLGPTGMLVALFSLADHLATFGPRPLTDAWERHLAVVRLLLASYVRDREHILPQRLLTADELMRRLKLDPGPRVGRLLDEIAEAQAEGRVHSREEALWLAEELLSRGVDET